MDVFVDVHLISAYEGKHTP